jgi:DNA-binding beta-propeller fold protein YncE
MFSRVKFLSLVALCLGLPLLVGAQETPAPGGYKILQTVSLPGDGGWDYLTCDSDARRVYVVHDSQVQVVDADTYKLLGAFDGIAHGHGVALAPGLNRGFVTNGGTGMISIHDLKTFKRISVAMAQRGADAVLYDKATSQVFSFNGDSKNSTVINAATGILVKTLDLDGKPEFAVADGNGNVFNNLEDKSLVLKIDSKNVKITNRWSLGPGKNPSGIAMDVKNNRLFIGCRNKMLVVLNAASGKVVASLPIGDHVDATYFDPDTGTVFNSCGDGTLSVIHEDSPDKYSLVENAQTEPGARTMAYDSKTGHIFLANAQTEPPPTPTKENPKPRPKVVPGTFHLLVLGR